MELAAKMEEKTCRLARETASGGEGEVGSDQEVRNSPPSSNNFFIRRIIKIILLQDPGEVNL